MKVSLDVSDLSQPSMSMLALGALVDSQAKHCIVMAAEQKPSPAQDSAKDLEPRRQGQ